MTTGIEGAHMWNSFSQLDKVLSGATIKWGPNKDSWSRSKARREMVWTVFPVLGQTGRRERRDKAKY